MTLVAFGDQGMHGFGTMQGAYWVGDGDFFLFFLLGRLFYGFLICIFHLHFPPSFSFF